MLSSQPLSIVPPHHIQIEMFYPSPGPKTKVVACSEPTVSGPAPFFMLFLQSLLLDIDPPTPHIPKVIQIYQKTPL